jgi:predicted outer membrane repeat protein
VRVAAGVYEEADTLQLDRPLQLIGTAEHKTIITGGGRRSVFNITLFSSALVPRAITGTIHLENLSIDNGNSTYTAGGMDVHFWNKLAIGPANVTLLLRRVSFVNNLGYSAGAIWVHSPQRYYPVKKFFFFEDVTFFNNTNVANGGGGVFFQSEALWDFETGLNEGSYFCFVIVVFTRCQFMGNASPQHAGGAASGITSGGGVAVFSISPASAQNGSIIQPVFFYSNSFLFRGCTFIENSASAFEGGGALYFRTANYASDPVSAPMMLAHNNSVSFDSCTFERNIGPHGGGAVYIRSENAKSSGVSLSAMNTSSFVFSSCVFRQNSCTELPGGDLDLEDEGCEGGAVLVYVDNEFQSPATIFNSAFLWTNCTFEQNSAASKGGAISVNLWPNYFSGNNCTPGAPLTKSQNNSFVIRRSSFAGNSLLFNTQPDDGMEYLAVGAAVHFSLPSDGCLCMDDGKHRKQKAWRYLNEIEVASTAFTGNKAKHNGQGGAIAISNGNATIVDSTFERNQAHISGGAIVLLDGTASLTVKRSRFAENTAETQGGTIHSASGGAVVLRNATLDLPANASTGLSIEHGNTFSLSDGAMIKCPVGTNLTVQNVSIMKQTADWCYKHQGTMICPPARLTENSYACVACPSLSYSLDASYAHDNHTSHIECLACPVGTDCSSGGAEIRVKPGYWCKKTERHMNSQHPTRLLCTPCPDEYCKTDQSLWTVSSGCAFNRTGILCGECRTGFSAAVGTSECVPNSECNLANRGRWLGVALLLYICWVLYLRCHNHTDSIRSCFFRSAVYFFQVCPLVLTRIPGHHNPVFAVIDPFLGLFDFRYNPTTYGSGAGAVCLEESMSTLQTNLLLLYSPVCSIQNSLCLR